MHTVNILRFFIEHHQAWAYFIIFLGLILEGELFIISTGILAHLGALDVGTALVVICLGCAGKTIIGYHIGKYIREKWHSSKFIRYAEKRVHHFMPNFQRKPFWSIFLSKFIIGANNIIIIFSGFKQINFKKFLKAEGISTLIWAPAMLALGYFFSYAALSVSREVWRFSLLILLFIVIFIFLDRLFGWLYELFEELHSHDNVGDEIK